MKKIFSLVGLILLFIFMYLISQHFLFPWQTKWHERVHRPIDQSMTPVGVISDKYKFIEQNGDCIRWGWVIKIKNNSNKKYLITATYILTDKDGFDVTSCTSEPNTCPPHDFTEIRQSAIIKREVFEKAKESYFSLSFE